MAAVDEDVDVIVVATGTVLVLGKMVLVDVDDVDVVRLELLLRAVPHAVSRGRLDGDALLALEIHRVHFGADAVFAADLVDFVNSARIEQDSLGERRLARVDVGGNTDVADAVEGNASGQGILSFFTKGRPGG